MAAKSAESSHGPTGPQRRYTFKMIDSDDPLLLVKGKQAVTPVAWVKGLANLNRSGLDRFVVLLPPPPFGVSPHAAPPSGGAEEGKEGKGERKKQHRIRMGAPAIESAVESTTTRKSEREPNYAQGTTEIRLDPFGREGELCMFPYPNQSLTDRMIVWVTGAQNSGKSTAAANIVSIFQRLERNEGKKVFIIARTPNDPAYRVLDPDPIYIPLESDKDKAAFLKLRMEDFASSLVIFDDTETFPDRLVQEHSRGLRDDILEAGRKHFIDILMTNHLTRDWQRTRRPLAEMTQWLCFPRSGSSAQLESTAKTYFGMTPEQIARIKALPGDRGWACVSSLAPRFVLHELGCWFL